MGTQFQQVSVLRFLFRLAARVQEMTTEEFLRRLVVGLANRYGASGCSIYRCGRKRTAAWAPVAPDLQELSQEDRAFLHNLDGRLVQEAMSRGEQVSGLDLDVDGDLTDFLNAHFPEMDIFAFPLVVDEGPRGAIVIYLPENSTPLTDVDIQAFMAIGEVIQVAEEDLCHHLPRLITDERPAPKTKRRARRKSRTQRA